MPSGHCCLELSGCTFSSTVHFIFHSPGGVIWNRSPHRFFRNARIYFWIELLFFISGLLFRKTGSASFPVHGLARPRGARAPRSVVALHETGEIHDTTRLWTDRRTLQVAVPFLYHYSNNTFTLQPHYNTVFHSMNGYDLVQACLPIIPICKALFKNTYFLIPIPQTKPQNRCYNEVSVYPNITYLSYFASI